MRDRLFVVMAVMSMSFTWSAAGAPKVLSAANALVNAVWADDANHVFAVGKAGRVFASNDRGVTWSQLAGPGLADLYAVWSDGRGHVVVAGEGGLVARLDGTWRVTTLAPKLTMRSVWGVGDWVVAVGGDRDEGVIAWSGDGGARWSYSVVHDTVLTAVSGIDPDHVVAVGTKGAIYASDGRYAWTPIAVPFIAHDGPDGSSTMTSNSLELEDYLDVRFDGGMWLATGSSGHVVESPGAHTWSHLDSSWVGGQIVFRRAGDTIVIGRVERAVLHAGAWKTSMHGGAELGKMWRTPAGVLYSAAYHGGLTANPKYFSNLGCPHGSTPQTCPAYIDVAYAGAVERSTDDGATWTLLTK